MSKSMEVEPVSSESDFASLTQWLMANTKDKEVRDAASTREKAAAAPHAHAHRLRAFLPARCHTKKKAPLTPHLKTD